MTWSLKDSVKAAALGLADYAIVNVVKRVAPLIDSALHLPASLRILLPYALVTALMLGLIYILPLRFLKLPDELEPAPSWMLLGSGVAFSVAFCVAISSCAAHPVWGPILSYASGVGALCGLGLAVRKMRESRTPAV